MHPQQTFITVQDTDVSMGVDVADEPALVNEFPTPFPDLMLYQRNDKFPFCYFTNNKGAALADLLDRIRDHLPGDATDAASLIGAAIREMQDEEDDNEETARSHHAFVDQSKASTLAALERLKTQLCTPTFGQLGVIQPMPPKQITLKVRIPARYREEPVLGRFKAELTRQLQIQLNLLNGQPMDRWFIKLDLFDAPKEQFNWSNWLAKRPTGYLTKLWAELLYRVQDEKGRTSMHGNARPRRQRLDEAEKMIRAAQTDQDVMKLLSTLDGEWAKDLVGRSNAQTKWKDDHSGDIQKLFTKNVVTGDTWRGLANPEDWRTLAPLHNPDQVAGGERHLPTSPTNIADYIGPRPVNSAIGRAWGLPPTEYDEVLDTNVATEPNRMQQLRREMLTEFPPACWALFTTNFTMTVELI